MKNNDGKFEVRDLRKKSKFVVDDKFLNGYARFVGIYAVGVYSSLCRHANKQQKCWPSIKKMGQELSISQRSIIRAIQYLEFWKIIKKERIGKTCNNRYFLIDKRHWRSITEASVRQFSEVSVRHFRDLSLALQRFISGTSIVRKHKRKETQKKGDCFSKKKKPYFWGKPMWKDKNGKWLVIHGQNDFRKFAGKESEIEWKKSS